MRCFREKGQVCFGLYITVLYKLKLNLPGNSKLGMGITIKNDSGKHGRKCLLYYPNVFLKSLWKSTNMMHLDQDKSQVQLILHVSE
jgi:hypothetical protein